MDSENVRPETDSASDDHVTPQGDVDVTVETDDGDVFAAAEAEALASVQVAANSPEDEETDPDDGETDSAEADAGDEDGQPETEDESAQDAAPDEELRWNGNMDDVRPEARPYVEFYQKEMQKGWVQKTSELAELRKVYERGIAQSETIQQQANGSAVEGSNTDDGPPPLPTGENVTQEQYDTALDARQKWLVEDALRKAKEAGEVIGKDDPDYIDFKTEKQNTELVRHLHSHKGYTPEIGVRVAKIAQSSEHQASKLFSKEGMTDLFHLAAAQEKAEAAQAELDTLRGTASQKTVKETKHKAGAGARAVSRPGAQKAPTASETFASQTFGTMEEAMAAAEASALETVSRG